MKKLAKLLSVTLVLAVLAACSSSPKTQVIQMGDDQLSKEQILVELAKLDNVQRDIDSNKGVTLTNTASFLLWWPGLAYTYYDASEASKLVEQRRSHLTNIYNHRYGSLPAPKKKIIVKSDNPNKTDKTVVIKKS